jgi:hypothetical protein
MSTDLRYPIGEFTAPAQTSDSERFDAIREIELLPARMRAAVAGLDDARADTPYRPGGWTVRQVVHHVADSHMNGFIRVKLALTEDRPIIKPYDEQRWAALADARLPVDVSLSLIDALHARWVAVYRAMTPEAFGRTFVHPELNGTFTLDHHLQLYAWHSRHHVAHITALRQREGW